MISEIISAVLQIIVLTAVPFIVFLVTTKSAKGFFDYIGLKKSSGKANLLALLVVLVLVGPMMLLAFVSDEFMGIMTSPESVTGKLRLMGFGLPTVVTILVAAIFKTALSEEIFFRGFLAKRLISVTGFSAGNLIQAVLFGAVHALIFLSITSNPVFLAVIFIFPSIGAYLITYLNERMANGSIIPGWIAHAAANFISYSVIAFIA